MSRFHCDDWDGEGVHPLMWEQTCRNAIRGQKGQAVLRELKEALLGLPQQRLIDGAFSREGEVCALGALARHRFAAGQKICWGESVIASLPQLEERLGDDLEEDFITLDLGERMGLKRALALAISFENDEGTWASETPEQRYWRILRWVENNLVQQPN
jgi:hypothetical protein